MKVSKSPKKVKFADSLPQNEREWLENALGITERSITGQGDGVDKFLVQQAEKLKKQIKDLK